MLFVLGITNLSFDVLELSYQILKIIISILHLFLFMSYTLFKFYHTVISLSQGCLVELQVIVLHLTLFLNVFGLKFLEIWAYFTKVVNYCKYLWLCWIKLILKLTNSFGGFFLCLVLGIGMKFARCIFSISNANKSSFIDLSNCLFFILLFGFTMFFRNEIWLKIDILSVLNCCVILKILEFLSELFGFHFLIMENFCGFFQIFLERYRLIG